MPAILIVDDDAALRAGIAETLSDLGLEALEAENGEVALARLERQKVDAVLLDLRMPGMDGLEVLRHIREKPSPPPVAILTAVPTASNTIEAMRLGAVDHIAKPVGRAELKSLLDRLLAAAAPRPDSSARVAEESGLIGTSPAMRDIQKAIGLLADSDSTVLITGETGTGKEVVAQAIHRHGKRASHPFIAINCAAIPAELLESQLFGHVRGAFTGAVSDRPGSFREAHGGTLFLDEIGDMGLPMQAKLLRVLQERVVTPVGGKPVPVDVRIIAATHQDLRARIAEKRFREDLFYRLGVVPLHLPPLRERPADIIPLAEHFLPRDRRLAPDAARRLLVYPWPGNVRELRNAMERVTAMTRQSFITARDLDFLDAGPNATALDWLEGDLPTAVARLEEAMIRKALQESGGNRTETARRLNIHRQLLHAKIRRYGIGVSEERTEGVRNADMPDRK
jgi:DNA-binding NtrC family response regulator